MSKPTIIKLAPWVKGAMSLAALSLLGMSGYFYFYGSSYIMRYGGMVVAAFAIAACADALASKIVLDNDTIQIVSLMRRRSFARSEFVSVQVERGAVVLKRKEGGWMLLPGTGQDPLSVRNSIHAWLTRA